MAAIEERLDGLDQRMARIEKEVRVEGERTRTYMKVLIEDVRDEIRLIAEGHVALDKRGLNQHGELKENVAALDTRVTRLEVRERRRRRRA